jgi:hypothetical protein
MRLWVLAAVVLFSGAALVSCGGSDSTGPGVSIHCGAEKPKLDQTPSAGVGDTTARVTCPPQT